MLNSMKQSTLQSPSLTEVSRYRLKPSTQHLARLSPRQLIQERPTHIQTSSLSSLHRPLLVASKCRPSQRASCPRPYRTARTPGRPTSRANSCHLQHHLRIVTSMRASCKIQTAYRRAQHHTPPPYRRIIPSTRALTGSKLRCAQQPPSEALYVRV